MMGFTADGQIAPALIEACDRRLGVSHTARRRNGAGIALLAAEGANGWESGRTVQMRVEEVEL